MQDIMMELTDRGIAHMEQLMQGEGRRLIITRIVTSSAAANAPASLTTVTSPVQELLPTNFRSRGPHGIIDAEFTNECNCEQPQSCLLCTTGYEIRQIGIYAARHPQTPTQNYNLNNDFLFRIAQFQNPTRVPARQERYWTFKPSFTFVVNNAANVEVLLDPRTHTIHKHRTILTDDVGVHGMRVDEGVLEYRPTSSQHNEWRKFVLRNDGHIHLA